MAASFPASGAAPSDRPAVNYALLCLRLFVGFIFLMHGSQKLLGAFGGPGLSGVIGQMGPVLGVLVSIGEFFGGLGLMVGVLTRFSAAALIVIMLGAIATVHGKNGFFAQNKGFEYPFALIGLLLPVLIAGPGTITALRWLLGHRRVPRRYRVISLLRRNG